MINLNPNFRTAGLCFVLFLVLLVVIHLGASSGKKRSFSESMAAMSLEHVKALDFFFQDNARFPTADEFAGESFVNRYFNREPQPLTPVGECPGEVIYTRPSFNAYQLNFCLETQVGEYKEGWNQISK